MRYLLFALLLFGCDTGVTVHDHIRAGRLVIEFLSSLDTPEGLRQAYEWTDDRFKQDMSYEEFRRWIAFVRERNTGADVQLIGFEVFGQVDRINVYANSLGRLDKLYFRFALVGNKVDDYYLLEMYVDDVEQRQDGIYHEYTETVVVPDV